MSLTTFFEMTRAESKLGGGPPPPPAPPSSPPSCVLVFGLVTYAYASRVHGNWCTLNEGGLELRTGMVRLAFAREETSN